MPHKAAFVGALGVGLLLVGILLRPALALAQVRGVYPTGMNATNAGVTPASGLTYSNLFIFNSRDERVGPEGEVLATGQQAIMIDLNTLAWVSEKRFLGGARFSATATLLFSNSSLASDAQGQLSGGGGFADSFYQPLILGWSAKRIDWRVAYGFLAPTGRFVAGAEDNVGSGYWTHAPSTGATLFLTEDRATAVSVFQMYEFHTTQEGTGIQPGQTYSIDYSLTHTLRPQPGLHVQLGLVGYGQWQTTDKAGPGVTPEQAADHYAVSALGFATSVLLPPRKASVALKYFHELGARSTFRGYSLQISGAIGF